MEQERCERFVEDAAGLAQVRANVWFVQDHAEAIKTAGLELPKSLSDRAAQIWGPLVILADLAGGDWPELARQAAVAPGTKAAEHNGSGLLFAIWRSFGQWAAGESSVRMLVQGLNGMDDKSWGTMANGKGITVGWLATQLERHRIKPRTIPDRGTCRPKGYLEEDFEEAFQRYMSPSDREAMKRLDGLLSPIDSGASPPAEDGRRRAEDRGRRTETEDGRNEAGDTPSSGHAGSGEHQSDGAGETQGGETAAA